MITAIGLGSNEKCSCQRAGRGKWSCDCQEKSPPPAPPPVPFFQGRPGSFPEFVRSNVAPWGYGARAYASPRESDCPGCVGTPVGALGADYSVIPYWCWDTAGKSNERFKACKDQAIASGVEGLCGSLTGEVGAQCRSLVTEAQKIAWVMAHCGSLCVKPAASAVSVTASVSPTSVAPAVPDAVVPPAPTTRLPFGLTLSQLLIGGGVLVIGYVVAKKRGIL